MCALEMKMEEKERELRAAKIDNEAVCYASGYRIF